MSAAVSVEHVAKRFRIYHERNQSLKAAVMRGRRANFEEFWALDDVSFQIEAGETFGIIGHNGSGKSTLLKCVSQILQPDRGRIAVDGKISALLELGAGFHPELSGRENVFLNGSILGLGRKEIERRFDEIVGFAGLEQFIDTPVKNYSSGMYVRLGFSVAINVEPDILMVDEVLAVGDATFQKKCTQKFDEFRKSGRTVVIVSHALGSVRSLCDRAALLDHGKLVTTGGVDAVVQRYLDDLADPVIETEGDDGKRQGTGIASIDGVEFRDPDGGVVLLPRSGEPTRMTLTVSSTEPIEDGVLQVAFRATDGRLLGGCRTTGAVDGRWGIHGHAEYHLDFDSFPLNGGRYHLSAILTNADSSVLYDAREEFYRFDVSAGEWASLPVGPVALVGDWSVTDLDG